MEENGTETLEKMSVSASKLSESSPSIILTVTNVETMAEN